MTATTKKVSARSVAAPKVAAPRAQFAEMAKAIEETQTTLSKLVYDAAVLARELDATVEENALLLAAIPKQRRSEYKRIVTAPAEWFGKKAPKNLTKLAKYLNARKEGKTDAQAAKQAEQGKAATAQRQPKPEGGNAKPGSLKQLQDAIEAVAKEYSDSPDVLSIVGDLRDMATDLIERTAEI